MKAVSDAILVGTEPWEFEDEETKEKRVGISALFITPPSTRSVRTSLPDPLPAGAPPLISMHPYQLELDIRERQNSEHRPYLAAKLISWTDRAPDRKPAA